MTVRILIGTASWADKPLVESGEFYPPEAKNAEQRLRYYASRFPLVEVDATYYGLPQAETAHLWVERTPPEVVDLCWSTFVDGIMPLHDAGKLVSSRSSSRSGSSLTARSASTSRRSGNVSGRSPWGSGRCVAQR